MNEVHLEPAVYLVSGMPPSGKTVVSRLLAQSFPRAAHIESDRLQRFIVSGGVWPPGAPSEEARRQMRLRIRNSCLLADSFFEAGFIPIIDLFLFDDLAGCNALDYLLDHLHSRPLLLVVLAPSTQVLEQRDAQRPRQIFHRWQHLDKAFRQQVRHGLWIDSSEQAPEETVAEILARAWNEAVVAGAPEAQASGAQVRG